MPSLVTLGSAPYNPYNTSLAEIALKGMEMGQAEMNHRDQLAQQGVENSMKASMMAADVVQKNAENNFKEREANRLDQQMVWGHAIDQERLGLAKDQFQEGVREFDATMPLREKQLAIESGRLDIAQAAETRASEEWDLAGRPAAKAQLGLREQAMKIREQGAQVDLQRAHLMLDQAKFNTEKAKFSIVDYKAYSTDLDDQIKWIGGVSDSVSNMLKAAEPKPVVDAYGKLIAAMQQRQAAQGGAAAQPRSFATAVASHVVTQSVSNRNADGGQDNTNPISLTSLPQKDRDTLKDVFFLAQQAKAAGLEFGNVNMVMRANRGAPSEDIKGKWIEKYDNWSKALEAFRIRASGLGTISGVSNARDANSTSRAIFNIDPRTGRPIENLDPATGLPINSP